MGKFEFGDKMRELIGLIGMRDMSVPEAEIDRRWNLDSRKAIGRRRRRILLRSVSVAAAACAVIVFLTRQMETLPSRQDSIEVYALKQRPAATSASNDVQLILADRTSMSVGGNDADIDYTVKGKIVVDSDTIDENSDDSAPRFNQLIVPHGRRTRLRLSDGTCLYVNSGTRVVYPLTFGTGDRTVFVEGEAYFEVAKDAERPFIVKTGNVSVRVLGTKFNVFAYEGENPNVVLVEGSVDIATAKSRRRMKPGEMVEASGTDLSTPQKVDVEPYISWTKSELIYENEPLSAVFKRLQIYYGLEFDLKCDISRMRVSGRLSLSEKPSDVLSAISFSVPIELSETDTVVKVTAKQ